MSTADQTTGAGNDAQGAKATAEHKVEQIKARAEEGVDKVKAEVEKAKQTVEEMGREISTAVDERRGGPATSVEDAKQKAATLRAGIERDVAALQTRVPDREDVTGRLRTAAIAVGGTIAAIGVTAVVFSRHRATKARERDFQAQAEALAAVLARAERINVPDDADEDGGWLAWVLLLLGAGGAGAYWWQHRQTTEADELWGPDPE
jgi:hypothetical protein